MNPNVCGAFGFQILAWISSSFAPHTALKATELILAQLNMVLHLICSAHTLQIFTDKDLCSPSKDTLQVKLVLKCNSSRALEQN